MPELEIHITPLQQKTFKSLLHSMDFATKGAMHALGTTEILPCSFVESLDLMDVTLASLVGTLQQLIPPNQPTPKGPTDERPHPTRPRNDARLSA